MLHEFLSANRGELIARCEAKVTQRGASSTDYAREEHGLPLFLAQVIGRLLLEQPVTAFEDRNVSAVVAADGGSSEMGRTAREHGRALFDLGFTMEELVHDYGDLSQSITDLAFEQRVHIQVEEFATLNRCLEDAIAGAVSGFAQRRDAVASERSAVEENGKAGFLAHEQRNLLGTAMLAFAAAKKGNLPLTGALGSILERSLVGLSDVINRSLEEARIRTDESVTKSTIRLSEFIAELERTGLLEAEARKCAFTVPPVDSEVAIVANRPLLLSAVSNLLQNAFKFTRPGSEVSLLAHAVGTRTHIEVCDHCGGLAPGDHETMFLPFRQVGADRSGLGLGLSMARRNVELNGGALRVRDVPGVGCVFTVDLPRHTMG